MSYAFGRPIRFWLLCRFQCRNDLIYIRGVAFAANRDRPPRITQIQHFVRMNRAKPLRDHVILLYLILMVWNYVVFYCLGRLAIWFLNFEDSDSQK